MKLIKYVLLTTVAIAFCGLFWLSKSTPVVSQPTVKLQTEPPLEEVIPDDTVVKFQLQAIDTNEQPLTDANLKVRILTPTKTPWFTADFPLVEGTELLNLGAIAPQGNLEFEQVLPIRGNYAMEVGVNPQITGAFEVFDVEKLAKSSFVSPKSAENLELSQLNSWQTAIKAMSSTSSAIARSNLWQ